MSGKIPKCKIIRMWPLLKCFLLLGMKLITLTSHVIILLLVHHCLYWLRSLSPCMIPLTTTFLFYPNPTICMACLMNDPISKINLLSSVWYIIYNFLKSGTKDMQFTSLGFVLQQFECCWNFICQNSTQTLYLERLGFSDIKTYKVCPKRI